MFLSLFFQGVGLVSRLGSFMWCTSQSKSLLSTLNCGAFENTNDMTHPTTKGLKIDMFAPSLRGSFLLPRPVPENALRSNNTITNYIYIV